MEDDSRSGAVERIAAVLVFGLLTGLLVMSTSHTNTANAQVQYLQGRLSVDEELIDQLMIDKGQLESQRDELLAEIDRLNALPPKMVVRHCDPPRVVPVFPRESQTTGSHR